VTALIIGHTITIQPGELKLIILRHQVVIKPASVTPAIKQHRPLIETLGSRVAQVALYAGIRKFFFSLLNSLICIYSYSVSLHLIIYALKNKFFVESLNFKAKETQRIEPMQTRL
jgi:hypothetical protein